MSHGFCRSLIVGLGGTGVRALVHLKTLYHRLFGGVPPVVSFLGIDTDEAALETLMLDGEPISLSQAEFIRLTAMDARTLVSMTPEIAAWAPPEDRMNYRDVVGGAGARRASGRLALFNRANIVLESLRDRLYTINSLQSADGFEFGETEGVTVDPERRSIIIISSIAGGTGSGILLDIAFMCRSLFPQSVDPLYGYLLMPGLYVRLPATYFVESNAYATLKELDFFLNCEEKTDVSYPGVNQPIPWGGPTARPFDFTHLIDNVNSRGQRVEEIDSLLSMLAHGVFLNLLWEDTSSRPRDTRSYLVNMSAILDALTPWQGQAPHYIGMGLSTLELPKSRSVCSHTPRIAEDVLRDWLLGSSGNPEASRHAGCEYIRDSVVRASSLAAHIKRTWQRKTSVVAPSMESISREDSQLDRGTRHSNATERFREQLSMLVAAEEFSSETLAHSLQRLIDDKLSSELHMSRSRISEVLAFLDGASAAITEEMDVLSGQLQEMRTRLAESSVDRVKTDQVPRLSRRQRRLARQSHGSELDFARDEMNLLTEEAAGVVAHRVLRGLKAHCEGLTRLLGTAQAVVHTACAPATESTRHRRRSSSFAMPFLIDVGADYLSRLLEEAVSSEAVTSLLESLGQSLGFSATVKLPDLALIQPRRLRGALEKEVEELLLRALEGATLDDALEYQGGEAKESTQSVARYVEIAIDAATPMWQVEPPPGVSIEEMTTIFIPRTSNHENSAIGRLLRNSSGCFRPNWSSRPGWHLCCGPEENSAYVLRVEIAACLSGLRESLSPLRRKYLELERSPEYAYTAHIHRDWVGAKGLPDILNPSGDPV